MRSYRVAEKSDPIARFSGPDRRKSWKIDGFYRISVGSKLLKKLINYVSSDVVLR
jgi:hypothetical protein